jgi:hypothetical protein
MIRRDVGIQRSLRVGCVALIALPLACDVIPLIAPIALPANLRVVPGGIADTRPRFGRTTDAAGGERGSFLLATCGCGDWRMLIRDPDGRPSQFPVHFYSSGEYQPTGDVIVFGREGELAALGTVNQDAGVTAGDLDISGARRRFDADRRETHEDNIEACVLCHIGDDPIWPQPASHIPYVEGRTDCLDCHEIVID